jgi:hypothetical protein
VGWRGRYELPTSVEAWRHNLSLGGLAGVCRRVGWGLNKQITFLFRKLSAALVVFKITVAEQSFRDKEKKF